MRILAFVLAAAGLLLPISVQAAPSFNCAAASYPDEYVICGRQGLAQLDVELARIYDRALSVAPPRVADRIERNEADWLESRHACGTDVLCIRNHYLDRIAELRAIVDRRTGDLRGLGPDDWRPGPDWERLGVVIEGRSAASIRLNRRDGAYSALRVRARGNGVRIREMEVRYGNGVQHDLDVERRLQPGEASQALPLRGRQGRFLDEVTVEFRGVGRGPRAALEIWGSSSDRFGRAPGFGPDWTRIGIAEDQFERAGDRVRVGRDGGRFDALRIRPAYNDVRIREVLVRYGNGVEHALDFEQRLQEGEPSGVIELRGRRGRFIDSVTVSYETDRRGPRATVEIWGRES